MRGKREGEGEPRCTGDEDPGVGDYGAGVADLVFEGGVGGDVSSGHSG